MPYPTFSPEWLKAFIAKAKENREKILASYRQQYLGAKNPRKRAQVIIELIKAEPSHLDEEWVRNEVEEWTRRHDSMDFLEDAFLAQKGRDRPTEEQSRQSAKDYFLSQKIDDIARANGISRVKAIHQILAAIDDESLPDQAELGYRKRYYRWQHKKKRKLPVPYWGRDVKCKDGRLLFSLKNFHGKLKVGNEITYIYGDAEFSVELIPEISENQY